MAPLDFIVERFNKRNLSREAVDRKLGLDVATNDGVAYRGIVALIGVRGFYARNDGIVGPVDVLVDEDGVSALAELGVVVVVVQDADDQGGPERMGSFR